MKKKIIRIGLIILILLLAGALIWLAVESNKKKLLIEDLQLEVRLERTLMRSMQNELFSTKDKLGKVKVELVNTREYLDKVNNKLAAARSANVKLSEEKNALEEKFHSLAELKGAIRNVKAQMRQERYEQVLAKREIQKEIDAKKLIDGNMGFVLKDGKPTYSSKVRIEVRPSY